MASHDIVACGISCNELFRHICDLCANSKIKNHPAVPRIDQEFQRFQLWAHNIAALQDASLPSSLGYRIRDDAKAQKLVGDALKYLEESLRMAIPIISGDEPNETWDLSDDENSVPTASKQPSTSSELGELFTAIQGGITNLFRLSKIIRKKPETDEYVKAANRIFMDPTPDIVHVRDRHPRTNKESWLSERLGTAITNRRQYMAFRRDHQQRLSEIHTLRKGVDGKTVWSGTKASTYLEVQDSRGVEPMKALSIPIALARDTKRTEYADSRFGKDGSVPLLRTPLLPRNPNGVRYSYGEDFECDLCRRTQKMRNKDEWKKHVFSDLRPYVCTFESCNSRPFESQHEWFDHELNKHRRQWACMICGHELERRYNRRELDVHISRNHADMEMSSHKHSTDACLLPRIDASECPLCYEWGERLTKVNNNLLKCDVSLKQFQQHLGRHMEQLALSALPQLLENDMGIDEHTDEESYTTGSDPSRKTGTDTSGSQSSSVVLPHHSPSANSLRSAADGRFDNDFETGRADEYPRIPGEPVVEIEELETHEDRRGKKSDKGHRRRAAKVLTAVADYFGTPADDKSDNDFETEKADEYPRIPGEVDRNPGLSDLEDRYNDRIFASGTSEGVHRL